MASFYYSGTPPYCHLVITVTFFWQPGKIGIHFLVKKPSLIRPPRQYGQFFGPNGGRINGVPLYNYQNFSIFFACVILSFRSVR